MIDSGSFPAALRRGYHYWFRPSGYSSTYDSSKGVIIFGELGTDYFYGLSLDSITIGPTVTQTIRLESDAKYKVGWIIYLWSGLEDSSTYMLARITAYDDSDPDNIYLTFQAYEAVGTGAFDYWTLRPQFENAVNFIQNPEYSARELSARVYSTQTADFNWPYDTTYENVVTSDTDLYKAGYSEATYDGQTTVYEDEYDINRPYIGITASSTIVLTTTTTTSTYSYVEDPPVVTTVTTSTTENLTQSHTYTSGDFIVDLDDANYFPGNPATYADGEITSYPTPSRYIKKVEINGTYIASSYDYTYEEYPSGSGEFRPIVTVDVSTSLSVPNGNPISPPDFFNAG
jgi:hypothetical protein